MTTTTIGWVLILTSILPVCSEQCPAGRDGHMCHRRNVALNRTTTQSSNLTIEGKIYPSAIAVDGKTGHDLFNTPCTHTDNGPGQYWTVTLDKSYWIYRFTIYNRNGGCGNNQPCGARLNGFTLSVETSAGSYTPCYQDITNRTNGPGDDINEHCTNPILGTIVKISLSSNRPLTLCEVLIYVCDPATYGPDCENSCGFCAKGRATCDTVFGNCPHRPPQPRCIPGYSTEKCDKACTDGWWGADCKERCGNCYNGYVCNKMSGECSRCSVGYKNTDKTCRTPCNDGWWGEDCKEPCGNCYNASVCNKMSGECPRCSAGYNNTDKTCRTPCNDGWWGEDCKEPCGNCYNASVCNKMSGECPRCSAGYNNTDKTCRTPCNDGWWGEDCKEPCGNCYNASVCNKMSGECPRCSDGYNNTDKTCRTPCNDGWWGEDCKEPCGNCYNASVCNKMSGECPRCSAGYNNTDKTCRTPCADGRWGADCEESCGNCYNGNVCDKTSGVCPVTEGNPRCSAGYDDKNTTCRTPCPDGRWGVDCVESCGNCYNGNVCKKTSGECPVTEGNLRCSADYDNTDKTCHIPLKATVNPESPPPAGKIAGSIVGVLLLVAVVVVVVVLYRRRRSSVSKDKNSVRRREEQPRDMDMLGNNDDVPVEVNEADVGLAYENPMTTVVSTVKFWDYYHKKKDSDGFSAEYAEFPVGLHAKHDVADLPHNKIKSRYKNLVAYDHSRVILKASDSESDYINASYIDGYEKSKKFIASQGPTDLIINDFMRMLWEQNVGTVVMVTNLVEDSKKKCHQYWPTKGSVKFGVIEVNLLDEEIYASYNIRTLQLSNSRNKPKILKQFHFTAWPDHGAPSDASVLLDFRDKVLEHSSTLPGPIVVHCSAGIGRTGTFIALDYLINQAKEEGMVDVPACVERLRQQRVNMVQTQEQYEFLHEALAEALKLSENCIPSMNFATVYSDLCTIDPVTGQSKMAVQFKILEDVKPKLDEASHKSARLKDNLSKNRNKRILAVDSCRPYLSTPVNGCNDYINAVFLPGCRKKRGFVLTQTPLPTTVVDFWRLVYDHRITTVIMLDYADTTDKDVGIYWTDQKGTFGPFEAEVTDVDQREDFSSWTYQLTYKDQKAYQPIRQFRYQKWSKKPSQESIPSFLTLLQSVEIWQKKTENAPILVHCRDGVTKSGLFCVAWSVLERLKIDQNVNILQTVRQMRKNRPEIITDVDQYRFLHQIVINYLDSYQTYANFI